MADDRKSEGSSSQSDDWEIVRTATGDKPVNPGEGVNKGGEVEEKAEQQTNERTEEVVKNEEVEAKVDQTDQQREQTEQGSPQASVGEGIPQSEGPKWSKPDVEVEEQKRFPTPSNEREAMEEKTGDVGERKDVEKLIEETIQRIEKHSDSDDEELRRADDSGDETADTDKEEEENRRRLTEAKKRGHKLVHRASFKRDRVDRQYDKLPWAVGAICRLLGLKMAPVNVPLHRRLETFAVLLWMSTFLFMGFAATWLLVYMFFYTQYWWVSLCYLSWYIPDRTICNRGGRRVNWVRKWGIWRHYRNFFPIHVKKTVELSPDHNYIMCYHPHGILAAGAFCTFATEGTGWSQLFPGLTPYLLTLEVLFLMPFYREFLLCSGAVSATRGSMDYLLGKEGTGRALCLIPGGAPESLDSHSGKLILHLNKRLGFAKMALRHGASLVPMFGFGETEIYDQMSNPPGSLLRRVQDSLQKTFGLAPCVFQGRGVLQYSFGFVPYRKPIYLVVGAPIHVDAVKKPTSEQIVSLHARYKEAITALYNEHKEQYARDPSVPIEFV